MGADSQLYEASITVGHGHRVNRLPELYSRRQKSIVLSVALVLQQLTTTSARLDDALKVTHVNGREDVLLRSRDALRL